MAYIDIDVEKDVSIIDLGMQGEKNAEGVRFDLKRWIEQYGSGGTAFIYIRRAGEEAAYLRDLPVTDDVAVWDFTKVDTGNPGNGRAQVLYEKADIIKKSVWYRTTVSESEGYEEVPDPYEDYLPEARSLLMEVVKNRADANASAAAADSAKKAAAASETAAAGSAEAAHTYAQQAAAVFAQVGEAELVVNEDSSVTAVFTKEE